MHKLISLLNETQLSQMNQDLKEKELVEETNHLSYIVTLRGTAHQNQSDFAFIVPHLLIKGRKILGNADPFKIIKFNHRLTLKFLQR